MKIFAAITTVMIGISTAHAAVNLQWYNEGAPDPALDRFGNIVISDASGNDEMAGALFQLIRATGPVALAPDAGGLGTTPATSGAELMVGYGWANMFGFGDGVVFLSETYSDLETTSFIYVRIWESPTTGGGDAPLNGWYWDTPVVQILTLPTLGDFRVFEFTPSTQAGWQLVPEPSVLAFMGIGAMLMAIRRRRA